MNFLLLNLIIALLFTAITTLSVGLLILVKSGENKANRHYAYTAFSVTVWTIFQTAVVLTDSAEVGLFFIRFMMIGVWMIPAFQISFTVYYLNLDKYKLFAKVGFVLSFISVVVGFTPYMFSGVASIPFIKYWSGPGFYYHIALAIFLIYGFFVLYELFLASIRLKGDKRNQAAYFFWSTLIGYAGGSTNFLYSYGIVIPYVHPFATYLVGIYPIVVAYAILRHQLMDIKVVAKKTFFYAISLAFISGAMVLVSFLSSWFAENIPGFKYWLVPLIAGLVAFLVGQVFWTKSKEVDKLKYEFITVAAHKLRTPLTEIKWGMDALKEKESDAEKMRLINSVQSANNRLIELTNELLMVSKTETARRDYNFEKINLERLARNIINDFQYQIKERGIKLDYKYERNLPMVMADRLRIGSVIQMLLENAVQYTKNKINISIDTYKDNVIFHIEDNGIGIKKDDQTFIFSKLYRSHEAYLTETEGTGIGLFLAKRIIDNHRGKIGVKSEGRGRGSVFWFGLKAVQ